MRSTGWIYDAYPENVRIILWTLTDDRRVLKLTDSFPAEFNAIPKQQSAAQLAELLADHTLVESSSVCMRYARIIDREKCEVIRVAVNGFSIRPLPCKLIFDLERLQALGFLGWMRRADWQCFPWG